MRPYWRILLIQILIIQFAALAAEFATREVFLNFTDSIMARRLGELAMLVAYAILYLNLWIVVLRLLIRGEPVRMRTFVRWRRMQWRIFGVATLMLAIVFAPLAAAEWLFAFQQDILALFAMIIGFGWIIVAGGRLAFSGPIVADEGPPHALRQSWILSRRCKESLAWMSFLLFGGLFAMTGILDGLAYLFEFAAEGFVATLFADFLRDTWTLVGLGSFAVAYVTLRESNR